MFSRKKSAKNFDCLPAIQLDSNLQENVQCKGIALIVTNNYKGTDKALPSADDDSRMMKSFFSTLQNYEIIIRENLKVDELLYICEYLASREYPEIYKRIVLYFAGHGSDGYIRLKDKRVNTKDIQAIFNPMKYPRLSKMARIFIFDACRGSFSPNDTSGGPDKRIYKADCMFDNELIVYSTLDGCAAHNNKKEGGGVWTHKFYTYLVLEKYHDKNICCVLLEVNQNLPSYQTTSYHSSLVEAVCFWEEAGLLTGNVTDRTAVDVDSRSLHTPLGQISLQVDRKNDKIGETKLIYVVHLSDSEQWVEETLRPILIELNTDMTTPNDFIPGRTPGQAHYEAVSKAHTTIIELAVEDKQSKEQKWFNFALSKAEHKNPDPSVITIIPVLHGDIPLTSLPATVIDIVPLKTDDPQFKSKIQKSIFCDDK